MNDKYFKIFIIHLKFNMGGIYMKNNIENFNFVKGERVVMNYSDSRPTCTSAKSFNRQDFSQNNRVFYIPKTVGFG